ncbi:MAG: hypothetical protein ABI597_05960, partial [Gammaproteobacteria bacterium]
FLFFLIIFFYVFNSRPRNKCGVTVCKRGVTVCKRGDSVQARRQWQARDSVQAQKEDLGGFIRAGF